jgi:hypothetical protein
MGLLLTRDTAISSDITARENTTKVAQEADISMSTMERNYGTFFDKAIPKKCKGKCDRIRRKTESVMVPETWHGVPDGI